MLGFGLLDGFLESVFDNLLNRKHGVSIEGLEVGLDGLNAVEQFLADAGADRDDFRPGRGEYFLCFKKYSNLSQNIIYWRHAETGRHALESKDTLNKALKQVPIGK